MPRKDQDSTPKWSRWDLEQNSPNHPLTSDQGGGTFRYKTFLINFIFLCIFSPFPPRSTRFLAVESGQRKKKLKKNAWRQLLRVKLRINSQVRQRLCCSEWDTRLHYRLVWNWVFDTPKIRYQPSIFECRTFQLDNSLKPLFWYFLNVRLEQSKSLIFQTG